MKKIICFLFVLTVVFYSCSPPVYYLEYRVNNQTDDEMMVIGSFLTFNDPSELDTVFVSANSCSTVFIDEITRNAKEGFANAGLDTIMVSTFEIYKNNVRLNRPEKPINNWEIKDKKGTSAFNIHLTDEDFN